MGQRTTKYFLLLLAVLVFLGLWHYGATRSADLRFFISTPSRVVRYAIEHWQSLAIALGVTTLEAVCGLFIALIVGHMAAFLLIFFPRVGTVLIPLSVGTQVLPIITLAPLFVMAFGLGLVSKVLMVALMCFFPIFISLNTGLSQVSSGVRELLFLYSTRTWFRILRVYWPLSLPHLFSGIRVACTMAIMGAIVTEFLGAYNGLGKNLYLAPKSTMPELMVNSVALTGLFGWGMYRLVSVFEGFLGKWYVRSAASESRTAQHDHNVL